MYPKLYYLTLKFHLDRLLFRPSKSFVMLLSIWTPCWAMTENLDPWALTG